MSNKRHYTDAALRIFVSDLDEGEQTLLVTAGGLPATFKGLEPNLTGSDVARMIEIAEDEGDAPKINTA